MHIAHKVLHRLGASRVFRIDDFEDPQTEEEFNKLEYESEASITWQKYQELYQIVETETALDSLRYYRNQFLEKTDWIMTVDNFQTLANKEDWIAYRQALRDLPTNPPPLKWKGTQLDIDNMNLPTQPPIIRTGVSS